MRYLLLCLLVAAGCNCKDTVYREADRQTFKVIGPEYAAYVASDTKLTKDEKARRINTLDTWGLRCGEIAMVIS